MAGKMTECSICGETVSRRKTLRVYGTYRACRKHEGVVEAAEDAQEALAEHYLERQKANASA